MSTIGIEPNGITLPMPTLGSYPECKHPLLPQPAFDSDAAQTMTVREIKEKFPRGYGRCPNCGGDVISYASFEHYIAGDW